MPIYYGIIDSNTPQKINYISFIFAIILIVIVGILIIIQDSPPPSKNMVNNLPPGTGPSKNILQGV